MTVSSLVHIAPAIEAIETITIWGTKAYALGSEIFTISAILWCLNFMGNMIQKTFEFGHAFGEFYRKYAHSHLKGFALGVIALAILMGQLTYEGAQVVYNNRNEILESANNFRNKVGSYFVYAWLITSLCWLERCPLISPPALFSCIVLTVEKTPHGFRHLRHRHLFWNQWCSRWNLRHSRDVGWAI